MSSWQRLVLIILSFLIVAFGQPTWSWWSGLIASALGYALFWRVLVEIEQPKRKFWVATCWAFAVNIVHTSWLTSHPFLYIYGVWFFFSFLWAMQLGLVSLLITVENVLRKRWLFIIAATWTLMEWARLFFMSGYTWNPAGLALSGQIYSLQTASVWGIYGMTFWVILVNLLLLRALLLKKQSALAIWIAAALVPYVYGYAQFTLNEKGFANHSKTLSVVLVQPAFPPEEEILTRNPQGAVQHVMAEWEQLLSILSKHRGETIDLVVLPEFVVPFGTYTPIYPYERMHAAIKNSFGKDALKQLPPLEEPWAAKVHTKNGAMTIINNAFLAQSISNLLKADVLIGLEDAEITPENKKEFYSAAVCFHPNGEVEERYEKRVLVPMAEYIPFSFCKQLAASYGITGSFTPGKRAKVFSSSAAKVLFGCCICYEETFGNLIRENKLSGAELLVNMTSDVWFPNSRLPWQHFDHARLRTVENGIPLIRSCNTGVTCAIDSLGRIVSILNDKEGNIEWISDSIRIQVPLYCYRTLYAGFGDAPIIALCAMISLAGLSSFVWPRKKGA